MRSGPDISRLGQLIGDPSRAAMLVALLGGQALTAGELARIASITPSTASTHLNALEQGGLIQIEKTGRHRYARLSGQEAAEALEALLGLAQDRGHVRVRPGPADPQLRRARTCYDHLAGALGVELFQALTRADAFTPGAQGLTLSLKGCELLQALGVDTAPLIKARRPVCRTCLDWSERTPHLAGGAGAALLTRIQALEWVKPCSGSRALRITIKGEKALPQLLQAWQAGAPFQP